MNRIPDSTTRHPILISALGLAPLLAPTQSLLTGLGMAVFFNLALLATALLSGGLRRLIPWPQQLVFLLLLSSTVVACADRLLQLWLFELHAALGIYLPLVAVNTLLLSSLEEHSLNRPLRRTLSGTAVTAALVMLIIPLAGAVRELLARGVLLADRRDLLPGWDSIGNGMHAGSGLPLFETAAGAFLVLGCLLAVLRVLIGQVGESAASWGRGEHG